MCDRKPLSVEFWKWADGLAEQHGLSYQLTGCWLRDHGLEQPRSLAQSELAELVRFARI